MREDDIRKLIALLLESDDISEIESVSGPLGFRRLRVSRRSAAAPAPLVVPSSPAASTPENENMEGLFEVTAPMVGTFYRAPNPGAESFVQEGSKVQSGSVLCIIEAMKLMNEIESGVSGSIQEILVDDGTPVEFGQILMRIQED